MVPPALPMAWACPASLGADVAGLNVPPAHTGHPPWTCSGEPAVFSSLGTALKAAGHPLLAAAQLNSTQLL